MSNDKANRNNLKVPKKIRLTYKKIVEFFTVLSTKK